MASEPDKDAVTPLVDGRTFDWCYYERYAGRPYRRGEEWLAFFGAIADRIVADIGPKRVLDAGCAIGILVECLRTRGIDAFGIDASGFAIEQVYDPFKSFCWQASVTDPLRENYDLIVCIEVLEHVATADAEAAIANFCAHTDDILFSSSPFHYSEATHVNTQPPEYWAAQFARHGFFRDVDFDASFVISWAARFRRRTDPMHRIVADYERNFSRAVIERNELRAAAVGIQQEIARLTQARDEMERRERATRAERDELENRERATRAERDELESRERATRAERDASTAALARACGTIALMERSWFWRARRPWDWISRQLGRSPRAAEERSLK